MNVYDFDKTIYSGDSTLEFYLFCLRKYPIIFCDLPRQAVGFFKYKSGKITKTKFKEFFFCFLKRLPDCDKEVALFWNKNQHKIKSWYKQQQNKDDVVISASPEFLLGEICQRQGICHLIASQVDKGSGIFETENCYGSEKVKRFRKKFPQGMVECFYSDSYSDTPMARISEKAFIVGKNDQFLYWNIDNEN